MALHLIKLCVGAQSVEDLQARGPARAEQAQLLGFAEELVHTTRQMPKRRDEVLDGGSLYWVIKGLVQVRQTIVDLKSVTESDGLDYCHIVLGPELIRTEMQPRRPFQGWRYLEAKDAPRDARAVGAGEADLDPEMRRQLLELGLL